MVVAVVAVDAVRPSSAGLGGVELAAVEELVDLGGGGVAADQLFAGEDVGDDAGGVVGVVVVVAASEDVAVVSVLGGEGVHPVEVEGVELVEVGAPGDGVAGVVVADVDGVAFEEPAVGVGVETLEGHVEGHVDRPGGVLLGVGVVVALVADRVVAHGR